MDDGSFWYKVFIVVFVMIGQGILWSWIGLQMSKIYSWWPLKFGGDNQNLVNTSTQQTK